LSYLDPLNDLHRQSMPPVYMITPLGPRVPFWRRDFACSVLRIWDEGGEVWISKRTIADRPIRSWLWVDGDQPGLTWVDIRGFFRAFARGEERGGEDGFFRMTNTAETRTLLLETIPGGSPQGCLAPPVKPAAPGA
jgi:hypothetical protein